MENLDQLKAVTFDVFGTVVDWRSSIAREMNLLGDEKGFSIDGAEFASAWRSLYQPSMSKVRSGEVPFELLDSLHRKSLDTVLERYEIDQLSEPEKVHLNRAWHRLDPWSDVIEGLVRLKGRYIIGTLSNGNISLIVNMAVLGAEVAGHYKPCPKAYLESAKKLDLAPHQCLLVAAHNADLHAASSCGFRTAFVARPMEYGPDQTTDLSADYDFDVIATDFVDLAGQLQA